MSLLFSLGVCTTNILIYNEGKCFKTGGNYENNDKCVINVLEDCQLTVNLFDTEYNKDFLSINGDKYSGGLGPNGVWARAGEVITFTADDGKSDVGFDICGVPGSAPPSSSSTDFVVSKEILSFIIGGCTILACLFLRIWCMISSRKRLKAVKDSEGGFENIPRNSKPALGNKSKNRPKRQVHFGGLLPQQSIEGDMKAVEFAKKTTEVQWASSASLSTFPAADVRPVYSTTLHDDTVLYHGGPILETVRTVRYARDEQASGALPASDTVYTIIAPKQTEHSSKVQLPFLAMEAEDMNQV
jgi:hypothetical protein